MKVGDLVTYKGGTGQIVEEVRWPFGQGCHYYRIRDCSGKMYERTASQVAPLVSTDPRYTGVPLPDTTPEELRAAFDAHQPIFVRYRGEDLGRCIVTEWERFGIKQIHFTLLVVGVGTKYVLVIPLSNPTL